MEVFTGAPYVRLQSRVRRGMYLAANVDGVGVCLSSQRRVHNTVWGVEFPQGQDGWVLLRSAYGRYLFAPGVSFNGATDARQVNREQNNPSHGMLWAAFRLDGGAFTVVCRLGRYIRANGRYLWLRRDISIAVDDGSTMMLWTIERVPLRLTRPSIHDPIYQLRHRYRDPPTEGQVTRLIRYVCCDANGDFNEAAWRVIELRTNSLLRLRFALANTIGHDVQDAVNALLCIRAGRFGQFSPLHIDLPHGNNRIDIVIVTDGTPVYNSFQYPDVTAP